MFLAARKPTALAVGVSQGKSSWAFPRKETAPKTWNNMVNHRQGATSMKLTKTASGKTALTITRLEWERIGRQGGWMGKNQVRTARGVSAGFRFMGPNLDPPEDDGPHLRNSTNVGRNMTGKQVDEATETLLQLFWATYKGGKPDLQRQILGHKTCGPLIRELAGKAKAFYKQTGRFILGDEKIIGPMGLAARLLEESVSGFYFDETYDDLVRTFWDYQDTGSLPAEKWLSDHVDRFVWRNIKTELSTMAEAVRRSMEEHGVSTEDLTAGKEDPKSPLTRPADKEGRP